MKKNGKNFEKDIRLEACISDILGGNNVQGILEK